MFIRVVSAQGRRYLQVVESYRQGAVCRHRVLVYLGRCSDREREQRVRELIRDYQPMTHARLVLAELEEVAGRAQGKGYFRKLRGWR